MAELNNPLFEDEKEFLERQKLEYERALLGDVDNIKEKTQKVGKFALIGAGLVGSIWLISKAFRDKKPASDAAYLEHKPKRALKRPRKGPPQPSQQAPVVADSYGASSDDLGFGAGQHSFDRGYTGRERADIGPDVFHSDSNPDPFLPLTSADARRYSQSPGGSSTASVLAASALQSFLQSDTGKMLIAQVTAVLMAYVAKKASDYFPAFKHDENPDLAGSGVHPMNEPETHDINFTYHNDADAPKQPL